MTNKDSEWPVFDGELRDHPLDGRTELAGDEIDIEAVVYEAVYRGKLARDQEPRVRDFLKVPSKYALQRRWWSMVALWAWRRMVPSRRNWARARRLLHEVGTFEGRQLVYRANIVWTLEHREHY